MLLLYDAECNLCCASVRFLRRHDPGRRLRLAPLGTDEARRALAAHGLDPDERSTVVLLEDGRAWTHSDAALLAMRPLERPWRWLSALRAVPRPLRDAGYRWVARNRHRFRAGSGAPCPEV